MWGGDPRPGWALGPKPGSLLQAPHVYTCLHCPSSMCRAGTTLRSTPTPGRSATAWCRRRTRYNDAASSFSQRQPMRRDQGLHLPLRTSRELSPRLREPLALALGVAEAPPLAQDPCLVLPTEGPALWARGLCGWPPAAGQLLVALASILQPDPMALAAAAARILGRIGFCLRGTSVQVLVQDRACPACLPALRGVQSSGDRAHS